MSTPFNNPEQGLGSASRRGSAVDFAGRTGSVSHTVAVENLPSKTILEDASNAQAREQSMTLLEGIRTYPKAIGWSLLFSTAIIMEGYDITILGSFFISPVFIEKFGILQPDGTRHITPEWQSGLGVAMQSGQIIGLFATGILADRFGYSEFPSKLGRIRDHFLGPDRFFGLSETLSRRIPWRIYLCQTGPYMIPVDIY